MLPVRMSGSGEPALVFLHFLGGSARAWDEVRALLDPRYRCLALDLPGFGDAAEVSGYTVGEMADAVAETLGSLRPGRFLLVGHSMGGKVAALLARRFADGGALSEPLTGLEGLILVAPSPPGPEPISDEKRASMLANLGRESANDWENASRYITKNESRVIPPETQARAVEDVLRMNRSAWRAWVEHGSQEDLSCRVGRLALPALIVVGENDTSLGAETQRRLVLPHLSNARLAVVAECGHLVPMEQPEALAALVQTFVDTLGMTSLPSSYRTLIESDRVSPRTREILLARLAEPVGGRSVFSEEERTTLRAALDRVVPQGRGPEIDLAARLEEQLATSKGDGWRYAVLPVDVEAYRAGLQTLGELSARLHGQPFALLEPGQQDELLASLASGDSAAMSLWFEDLRADAAGIFAAHPATLARMGYSGIGVGGAHTPYRGFVQMSIGDVEPWEPKALEGDSE